MNKEHQNAVDEMWRSLPQAEQDRLLRERHEHDLLRFKKAMALAIYEMQAATSVLNIFPNSGDGLP